MGPQSKHQFLNTKYFGIGEFQIRLFDTRSSWRPEYLKFSNVLLSINSMIKIYINFFVKLLHSLLGLKSKKAVNTIAIYV